MGGASTTEPTLVVDFSNIFEIINPDPMDYGYSLKNSCFRLRIIKIPPIHELKLVAVSDLTG